MVVFVEAVLIVLNVQMVRRLKQLRWPSGMERLSFEQ